jgi:uncharacterized protein YbjT (DUF2867 family)
MNTAESTHTFAVAGATGRLGRPLAERLLARGHRVRLLSRRPEEHEWTGHEWRGAAEPVHGDFDDPASLRTAFDGVDAVFGTGTAHRAGPAGEARHGIALAEAAHAAGVPHLVFVSGAGAERPTSVPVFESKRAVEERIGQLRLAATVLAPVYFMENAFNPWNLAALSAGRFPLPLSGHRVLQQVAIEDIASLAVLALERPEEFAGRRIELASDDLTGVEAAAAVSRATARRFEFEELARATLAPPLRILFDWLDHEGTSVDIAALRRDHPEVSWHSFEDWAATQEWPAATSSYTRAMRSASAGHE